MYSHHSSRLDYEFWSEGFPKRKEDERSTKRSNENWGAGWLGWMAETTAKRLHVERSDGMIEEFTDGGQQSSAALQPIKSFL